MLGKVKSFIGAAVIIVGAGCSHSKAPKVVEMTTHVLESSYGKLSKETMERFAPINADKFTKTPNTSNFSQTSDYIKDLSWHQKLKSKMFTKANSNGEMIISYEDPCFPELKKIVLYDKVGQYQKWTCLDYNFGNAQTSRSGRDTIRFDQIGKDGKYLNSSSIQINDTEYGLLLDGTLMKNRQ